MTEKDSLSLAISPGNFTDARQALEHLFRMLALDIEFKEEKISLPWFIEGRTAAVLLKGRNIGFLGEIHPKILKNWKMKMPVALFEINLDDVFDRLE